MNDIVEIKALDDEAQAMLDNGGIDEQFVNNLMVLEKRYEAPNLHNCINVSASDISKVNGLEPLNSTIYDFGDLFGKWQNLSYNESDLSEVQNELLFDIDFNARKYNLNGLCEIPLKTEIRNWEEVEELLSALSDVYFEFRQKWGEIKQTELDSYYINKYYVRLTKYFHNGVGHDINGICRNKLLYRPDTENGNDYYFKDGDYIVIRDNGTNNIIHRLYEIGVLFASMYVDRDRNSWNYGRYINRLRHRYPSQTQLFDEYFSRFSEIVDELLRHYYVSPLSKDCPKLDVVSFDYQLNPVYKEHISPHTASINKVDGEYCFISTNGDHLRLDETVLYVPTPDGEGKTAVFDIMTKILYYICVSYSSATNCTIKETCLQIIDRLYQMA
jgi:hypothetical protein